MIEILFITVVFVGTLSIMCVVFFVVVQNLKNELSRQDEHCTQELLKLELENKELTRITSAQSNEIYRLKLTVDQLTSTLISSLNQMLSKDAIERLSVIKDNNNTGTGTQYNIATVSGDLNSK
jgi:hypothetical protein